MKKNKGFTLSEVLITLTVIGIIAAITINIIATNSRRTEIETKLKRTVSILNSAMYRATIDYGQASNWPEIRDQESHRAFMEKYIAPYLITLKPLQDANLKSIGYTKVIKIPNGGNFSKASSITENYPIIILNDGSTLINSYETYGQFAYIFDTNGAKGPNVTGRDVFVVAIDISAEEPFARMLAAKNPVWDNKTGQYTYPSDVTESNKLENVKSRCASGGEFCGYLIERNSFKIPNDYPIKI